MRRLAPWLLTGCALFGCNALAQDSVQGVFVNANTSQEVIDKAIDAGVEKMNFIKRPIARSRLKKTNPLYQRIEIGNDGSQISVRFDAGKPVVMPANGGTVKWTRDDGEVFDVSALATGSKLQQTFKAEDGQRVNEFDVAADGTLTLRVTLTSPQLSAPVSYVLTYKRG
jgi:hypothetical protein